VEGKDKSMAENASVSVQHTFKWQLEEEEGVILERRVRKQLLRVVRKYWPEEEVTSCILGVEQAEEAEQFWHFRVQLLDEQQKVFKTGRVFVTQGAVEAELANWL